MTIGVCCPGAGEFLGDGLLTGRAAKRRESQIETMVPRRRGGAGRAGEVHPRLSLSHPSRSERGLNAAYGD